MSATPTYTTLLDQKEHDDRCIHCMRGKPHTRTAHVEGMMPRGSGTDKLSGPCYEKKGA